MLQLGSIFQKESVGAGNQCLPANPLKVASRPSSSLPLRSTLRAPREDCQQDSSTAEEVDLLQVGEGGARGEQEVANHCTLASPQGTPAHTQEQEPPCTWGQKGTGWGWRRAELANPDAPRPCPLQGGGCMPLPRPSPHTLRRLSRASFALSPAQVPAPCKGPEGGLLLPAL